MERQPAVVGSKRKSLTMAGAQAEFPASAGCTLAGTDALRQPGADADTQGLLLDLSMNAVHEEFPSLVRVSLTVTAAQAGNVPKTRLQIVGPRLQILKVDLKKAGLLKPVLAPTVQPAAAPTPEKGSPPLQGVLQAPTPAPDPGGEVMVLDAQEVAPGGGGFQFGNDGFGVLGALDALLQPSAPPALPPKIVHVRVPEGAVPGQPFKLTLQDTGQTFLVDCQPGFGPGTVMPVDVAPFLEATKPKPKPVLAPQSVPTSVQIEVPLGAVPLDPSPSRRVRSSP